METHSPSPLTLNPSSRHSDHLVCPATNMCLLSKPVSDRWLTPPTPPLAPTP